MNLRLARDKAAPDPGAAGPEQKALSLLDRPGSTWRLVIYLALPVLAQQALVLSVSLSDRFLAGRLEPLPRAEQAAALSHEVAALGQLAGGLLPGNVPGNAVAAAWRGRLAEHLGTLDCELVEAHAARLLDDPDRLAALNAATALLLAALPEREPHPDLYASFAGLLDVLDSAAFSACVLTAVCRNVDDDELEFLPPCCP